jgi:hypothetical protein
MRNRTLLLGAKGIVLSADYCRRLVIERKEERRVYLLRIEAAQRSMGSSCPPLFWGCVADMLLLGWLRGRDMGLPMVTPASTCLFA